VPAGASVQEAAEGTQLAALDAMIGRYLRGEVPAYRGSWQASDNQGVLGAQPNWENKSIPASALIASLDVQGNEASLWVHSPSRHQYILMQQSKSNPGVTQVSIILGDSSTGGGTASCTGCAPDFFSRPTTLDLSDLSATASVMVNNSEGDEVNVTLKVNVRATLGIATPCSLEFSDLAELGTQFGVVRFEVDGDEMVSHVFDDVMGPTNGACNRETSYTLDAFVSLANLADYGVRNYEQGSTTMLCPGAAR
jgi:hypothetical protein